jgi:hypothetical protein
MLALRAQPRTRWHAKHLSLRSASRRIADLPHRGHRGSSESLARLRMALLALALALPIAERRCSCGC